MIPIPKIALVGRPNVGKSTLFNRICGRRKAITDRRAGSTRDRNYAQLSWQGAAFELVDTGGLLMETDDPLLGPAADQAQRAIDAAIGRRLRRGGKRVVVAVNKVEGAADADPEFARLGFPTVMPLSAEHGQG